MKRFVNIISFRLLLLSALFVCALNVSAQNDSIKADMNADTLTSANSVALVSDSIKDISSFKKTVSADSAKVLSDSIPVMGLSKKEIRQARRDSIRLARELKRATWSPDPKRALWLALVLPGAGQIYNRKYWKLPIIYGGFVGCVYAMTWNDMMYHDYSQAYVDIMDNDPNTQSYNQFLHLGGKITEANAERYKTLFKKRKDYYRRYRDLSFFCLIGVYALSVIDAYVDASLSQFDISKDISLRVAPSVIHDSKRKGALSSSSVGVQCSLTF